VNIGLFPDVGGGYFLSRCPGQIGTYLGLSGEIINAADAIEAGLADIFIPSTAFPQLLSLLATTDAQDLRQQLRDFAAEFEAQAGVSQLAQQRTHIDQLFAGNNLADIIARLQQDNGAFAQHTLATMNKRSPLLMAVTLEQLRRGADMSVAQCLRMERDMVRHCFKHGEVLEGVRALVVDKDNAPQWSPATVAEVDAGVVASFFVSPWPDYAHPLRHLA
jgi:enoyl-CoA hydratase/carnithine racemase